MAYSTIDIGSAAVNRAYTQSNGSYLQTENSANATGVLTTFQTHASFNGAMKVGTMYAAGGMTFTYRDHEEITVTAGSTQTFTGKNCSVVSGDFICWHSDNNVGGVDQDNSTGATSYYQQAAADYLTAGNHTFEKSLGGLFWSVYGTGITVPDAPTSVSATDDLSDKVTVTWTAGTGETDGHRVYRDGADVSGIVAHGTATYDDVPNAGTYSYTVKAINAAGLSSASSADSGTRTTVLPIFNINVGGTFLPKKIKYYNSSIWINMEEYLISETNDAIITEAGDYIVTTDGPTIKYYDGAEWKIFSA